MQALWQRLTRRAADCPLDITFNPGASETDIEAAGSAGMKFALLAGYRR